MNELTEVANRVYEVRSEVVENKSRIQAIESKVEETREGVQRLSDGYAVVGAKIAGFDAVMEHLRDTNNIALERQIKIVDGVEKIHVRLDDLEKDIVRFKGITGGVIMVLSAIGAVIAMSWEFIMRKLGI